MGKSAVLREREEEIVLSAALITVLSILTVFWTDLEFLSILLNPEELAELLGPYGTAGVIAGQFV